MTKRIYKIGDWLSWAWLRFRQQETYDAWLVFDWRVRHQLYPDGPGYWTYVARRFL